MAQSLSQTFFLLSKEQWMVFIALNLTVWRFSVWSFKTTTIMPISVWNSRNSILLYYWLNAKWCKVSWTILWYNCCSKNTTLTTQYGHNQSEKKLGVGVKYHRSIKVHKYLGGPESASIEIPSFRPHLIKFSNTFFY